MAQVWRLIVSLVLLLNRDAANCSIISFIGLGYPSY